MPGEVVLQLLLLQRGLQETGDRPGRPWVRFLSLPRRPKDVPRVPSDIARSEFQRQPVEQGLGALHLEDRAVTDRQPPGRQLGREQRVVGLVCEPVAAIVGQDDHCPRAGAA